MHTLKKHRLGIFIFSLSFIGVILRFYNLNWGSPFYFHPDERNIASSVSQLSFPAQMNPNFFAYGSFPIYLIYFTGFMANLFLKPQDLFIQSIIISRFYSAIFSVLIIPSVYFVGTELHSKKVGLLAAMFCVFSVGFIQFAHFGTFEMWLTFFGIWFFYFSLRLVRDLSLKNITIIGTILGLLMSIKISSLPLLILPIIATIANLYSNIKIYKKKLFLTLYSLKIVIKILTLIFISLVIFAVFSSYVFLDSSSFLSSMRYESSVAFGTLPVFYTGEFLRSIPVLFQFAKIYPFLINPLLTVLFIFSFVYVLIIGLKKKNYPYLMLITCYLILFVPQAFLFAKWTRYIMPTLPFTYLIIAISFFDFTKFLNKKMHPLFNYQYTGISLITITGFTFALSYFFTVFVKQDARIEASLWAKKNIPNQSVVLSEIYDMGIVPFNQYLSNISLFNFYDLDESLEIKSQELAETLKTSEYIILPSPRLLKTRLINPTKFPYGHNFYNNLVKRSLEYEKIYETSCDIFCKITYLGDPVFSFEGTTNVFDHPTVIIFKKM